MFRNHNDCSESQRFNWFQSIWVNLVKTHALFSGVQPSEDVYQTMLSLCLLQVYIKVFTSISLICLSVSIVVSYPQLVRKDCLTPSGSETVPRSQNNTRLFFFVVYNSNMDSQDEGLDFWFHNHILENLP